MEVKPKQYGSPIINIKCSECGAMFSEKRGHSCNGKGRYKDGYY